ncbi:MAG: CinA family nicotinamide mononucleotide deamidase-related protein [Tannerella sp.]|jgi:nicotinamide-nucleotide amidase|nr:CinA family nicotinamide mononucleotide deamidase-related protein [Tannerella sp.]
MNVEIITIGDELLIGQVVDTNSAWMAKALNDCGFMVVRKVTVGDVEADILHAIDEARSRVQIVLLTGGLGPTRDDITLHALCRYFDCSLQFSAEVYANIESIFGHIGHKINELTRRQALVPDKAVVIQNAVGTAPSTWFEQDDVVLVSIPGVPAEMKWLMENEILPRLNNRFNQDIFIRHRTSWVSGYAESALAQFLTSFEDNLPDSVKLAYLPQPGIIRLRLSAYCKEERLAEELVDGLQKQLSQILGSNVIAEEDTGLEVVVGEKFRRCGLTLCTAESCTGGAIAALLTSVPGSSDYFRGSVVAYSNDVKTDVLSVSKSDLQKYGAVSRPVVEQMAQGALRVTGCDYAVATSGVAGPGGGADEKPVGTVWIAVADKNHVVSQEFHFTTLRDQNILRAVSAALIMLLKELIYSL